QQRRVLLDEVQQVFLGLGGVARFLLVFVVGIGVDRDGTPQVIDLALQILLALLLAPPFFFGGDRIGAFVAVHAVVHQRVAGVEQVLHGVDAVTLLALTYVLLGKHQVIDDRASVGPAAEQVVALEEGIVAVAGVGDHQRLHGHGVLFHQVGNTGIGVDHDLIGQAHLAPLVVLLRMQEMLAVGPVVIPQRHTHRGIGVHH